MEAEIQMNSVAEGYVNTLSKIIGKMALSQSSTLGNRLQY